MSERKNEVVKELIFGAIGICIGLIPWVILSLKYDA